MIMELRMNPYTTTPDLAKLLVGLGNNVEKAGVERSLLELVKIRASQINGCAVCLTMHTEAARREGETERRIYLLDAWRDSALYSARERAALGWTEALTRLSPTGVPDDVYEAAKAEFTEKELAILTFMVTVINSFNRLNVGFSISDSIVATLKAA
jgi:AhpD family alkylhydroperoxidase